MEFLSLNQSIITYYFLRIGLLQTNPLTRQVHCPQPKRHVPRAATQLVRGHFQTQYHLPSQYVIAPRVEIENGALHTTAFLQ